MAEPTKEDYARKIDRRILPLVALTYLLCYLDRTNIGENNESPLYPCIKLTFCKGIQKSSIATQMMISCIRLI
ncbi:hypothetical protein N7499_002392 [Penicillium canescens]|uniref:Uncharacterized protein n=1 Tax=Penicillium canescens TaxID=5083 RepID=A0AAD6I880_PENCN|nr:uncharacterized protein N7446_009933 [Penicillium canescens]KAJ6035174.1 hypothetical protein N7460_009349 [Penicillium canescens]KAJ6046832.1 hypothetical protein N7444_008086 [Penicillium canescens]KAJ6053921.1 hypothetical protein N7446_009933 [Penicillium canescens]KAJ6098018.1 hypothetical protein N7499_002392 [Penicillium canescens]KAJ6166005.1 hypothetical protein N7485_009249 [Penicillium canescens]